MRSLAFSFVAGAAALWLAGCSTAVSPKQSAKIDPQKTGLVLASLNQTGSKTGWVEFTLHRVDGSESSFHKLAISPNEKLTLIEVPLGHYEIAGWTVSNGEQLTGPGTQPATQPFEFDVRPGQITYLGHFEVVVRWLTYPDSASHIYSRAWPVLEDRHAKEIGAFHQQYPALADVPVRSVAPQRVALVQVATGEYAWFPDKYLVWPQTSPEPMPDGPKWP